MRWSFSLFRIGDVDISVGWSPRSNAWPFLSDPDSPRWDHGSTNSCLVFWNIYIACSSHPTTSHQKRNLQRWMFPSIDLLLRERSRSHCFLSRDRRFGWDWTSCPEVSPGHRKEETTDAKGENKRIYDKAWSLSPSLTVSLFDRFRGISLLISTVNWFTSVRSRSKARCNRTAQRS